MKHVLKYHRDLLSDLISFCPDGQPGEPFLIEQIIHHFPPDSQLAKGVAQTPLKGEEETKGKTRKRWRGWNFVAPG